MKKVIYCLMALMVIGMVSASDIDVTINIDKETSVGYSNGYNYKESVELLQFSQKSVKTKCDDINSAELHVFMGNAQPDQSIQISKIEGNVFSIYPSETVTNYNTLSRTELDTKDVTTYSWNVFDVTDAIDKDGAVSLSMEKTSAVLPHTFTNAWSTTYPFVGIIDSPNNYYNLAGMWSIKSNKVPFITVNCEEHITPYAPPAYMPHPTYSYCSWYKRWKGLC